MSQPPSTLPDRPVAGAIWMLLAGLFFIGVTAVVKHGAQELPAPEAAFLRYLLGLVFVLPVIGQLRRAKLTHRQLKHFTVRGAAHTLAVMLWFFAMTRITMAEVTAMNYMTPIYVTIGAVLFLGERVAARRWFAVCVAFLGALIILRPGMREISDGHIAMLGTAAFFGISYLSAKLMADELPAGVVVAMLSIIVTIGLLPFAIAVWQTPTFAELGWMFIVAILATLGHYCMTLSFAAAPVSVTQPMVFLQLVWSTAFGIFLFNEPADPWVLFGGTIIVAATTFIAIREAMLRRKHKAA